MPIRRSPLTRHQLRQIGERSQTRDTRDLLWEIHRLRAIALRSDQLLKRLLELGIEAKPDPTTKLLSEGLVDTV